MRGGGMPGGDALVSGVASVSAGVPSAGEVLRVGAYVVDLIGDDRVSSVTMFSLDRVDITIPDPVAAEAAAGLLGLDERRDLAATDERAATGWGGHSYWAGLVRGVRVRVASELRPGALPQRRPYGWKPEVTMPVPYAGAKNVRNPHKVVA